MLSLTMSGKTDNILKWLSWVRLFVSTFVRTYVRVSAVANISATAIGILMKPGTWVPETIPQTKFLLF
jgi:hypothetical protein